MPDRPLFLERASFRRRRLGDAARVLPVLALVAILLPVWWLPAGVSLAFGAVWLFGTWAVLIVLEGLGLDEDLDKHPLRGDHLALYDNFRLLLLHEA